MVPSTSATTDSTGETASKTGRTTSDRTVPKASNSVSADGNSACTSVDSTSTIGPAACTTMPRTSLSGGRTLDASDPTKDANAGRTVEISGIKASARGPTFWATVSSTIPSTGNSCPDTSSMTGISGCMMRVLSSSNAPASGGRTVEDRSPMMLARGGSTALARLPRISRTGPTASIRAPSVWDRAGIRSWASSATTGITSPRPPAKVSTKDRRIGSSVGHASSITPTACSSTGVNFPPASAIKSPKTPFRDLMLLVRPPVSLMAACWMSLLCSRIALKRTCASDASSNASMLVPRPRAAALFFRVASSRTMPYSVSAAVSPRMAAWMAANASASSILKALPKS